VFLNRFWFETHVAAKVIDIDSSPVCTLILFFDLSHDLPGCSFTASGYIHDVLCVYYDACWQICHVNFNFCEFKILPKAPASCRPCTGRVNAAKVKKVLKKQKNPLGGKMSKRKWLKKGKNGDG
jgi:hypothetical protein